AHARLRLALLETLLDHDIARLLESLEMRAEVAISRPDQLLEPRELDRPLPRRDRIECGHDLQPHGLMNDFVGTAHRATPLLPSQMPPTIRVPLSTPAIHKRNQGSDWRKPTAISAMPTRPRITKKRPSQRPARMMPSRNKVG